MKETSSHGTFHTLKVNFDAALERLPIELGKEGFGVITQIDLTQTFKMKLGIDFRRYRILGACNPKLAHAALDHDLAIGVLLPCNVALYERDDGVAVVGAIDPAATLGAGSKELGALAADVGARLERVLTAMAQLG
jgi:uncharacterized protein (DUF302 family)